MDWRVRSWRLRRGGGSVMDCETCGWKAGLTGEGEESVRRAAKAMDWRVRSRRERGVSLVVLGRR